MIVPRYYENLNVLHENKMCIRDRVMTVINKVITKLKQERTI